MLLHWCPEQSNAKALVKWRDLLSGQWKGPDPLLTSSRGYACIFPQDADSPIWVPDRLILHVLAPRIMDSPASVISKKEEASSTPAPSASTGSTADPRTADIEDPGRARNGATRQTDVTTSYTGYCSPWPLTPQKDARSSYPGDPESPHTHLGTN